MHAGYLHFSIYLTFVPPNTGLRKLSYAVSQYFIFQILLSMKSVQMWLLQKVYIPDLKSFNHTT